MAFRNERGFGKSDVLLLPAFILFNHELDYPSDSFMARFHSRLGTFGTLSMPGSCSFRPMYVSMAPRTGGSIPGTCRVAALHVHALSRGSRSIHARRLCRVMGFRLDALDSALHQSDLKGAATRNAGPRHNLCRSYHDTFADHGDFLCCTRRVRRLWSRCNGEKNSID